MLSFKISQETHRKVRLVSTIVCTTLTICFILLLLLSGIASHLRAKRILADHTVIEAPVHLDNVTEERGRRGRTKEMMHFTYRFEVKGQPYIGRFDVASGNADRYPEGRLLKIAYSNSDPRSFDRLERLEGQIGLGGLIQRLSVGTLGGALLGFIVHLLATRKLFVPREEAAAAA